MYSDSELMSEIGKRYAMITALSELEYWLAFSGEILDRLEKMYRRLKQHAKISDGEFKNDVRYMLGYIAAMEEVLGIPQEIQRFVKAKVEGVSNV